MNSRSIFLLRSVIFVSAVLFSLPLFIHSFGQTIFPLQIADDTLYYLTRIEIWKSSNGLPLNPYHDTSFQGITHYTFIIESLLALLAKLFSASANLVHAFVTFFSFLINCYLVLQLARELRLSAISGFTAFLLSYVVLVAYAPYRPISPQLNITLYLLICLIVVKAINSKDSQPHLKMLSGLQLVLWFVYPYFALLSALIVSLQFILALRSDFRRLFKRLTLIVLMPALPWATISFFLAPVVSAETAARTGMVVNNHYPGAAKILVISILIFVVTNLSLPVSGRPLRLHKFLWLHGLSLIIAVNSQVLTGRSLLFESHFILPFFLNVSFILTSILEQKFQLKASLISLALVLPLTANSLFAYSVQAWKLSTSSESLEHFDLFDFIQKEVGNDEIISAPLHLSEQIVFATHRKVLATPVSRLYLMSDAELETRVLVNQYPEELKSDLPELVYVSIFGLRFREAIAKNSVAARFFESARTHTDKIRTEEQIAIQDLVLRYQELNVARELDRFNVTWVIRSKGELFWFKNEFLQCRLSAQMVGEWEICHL